MTDIRYVCLSDTHFGEEDSLLTNLKTASTDTDPTEPSPVMQQLVACLKDLISKNQNGTKPTLILNGDILELALCTTNEAAMVFERFIDLIMPENEKLFEKIVYIPGNHDHHLWEMARETQYINHISSLKNKFLPIPWHATNMFADNLSYLVPSFFLSGLLRRNRDHLKDINVTIAYPNLGLIREDKQKCIIFTHGHFIEPLYHLMSTMRNLIFPDREKPRYIWDIEAENFAWIDFFWSTMGRSAGAGKDVEVIYEKMHDKEAFKKLLYTMAESLAKKYDLPGWGDIMEAKILKLILSALVEKAFDLEKTKAEKPLSKEGEKGLWAYMNGPLKTQILLERKENMPRDVTFVFGHTHKPFSEDMNFREYPEWVNVYNTGGWIVESVDPEPLHGSAVILVDDELNAVSLRMHNENQDSSKYAVRLEEATHEGERNNPLFEHISHSVNFTDNLWKEFSSTVARAIRVRAQNLRARINEKE